MWIRARGLFFASDFSKANVITLFLLPGLNLKLRPILLDMKPGTRVVSNSFDMGDWQADETVRAAQDCTGYCRAFLWIVPASVAGDWEFRPTRGGSDFSLTLHQSFQVLTGELTSNGVRRPLERTSLRGVQIRLGFLDDAGAIRWVSGTVKGDRIDATLSDPTGTAVRYRGRRVS